MRFDAESYNAFCEGIRKAITDLVDAVWPFMEKALNIYLQKLFLGAPPQPVVEFCNKVLRWAWDVLRDFVDVVLDIMEGVLVPLTAYARAIAWRQESDELGLLRERIEATDARIATTWSGTGATAYRLHSRLHVQAFEDTQAALGTIAGQCESFATSAYALYYKLAKTIAEGLVGATAGAGTTPLDGPAGPAAAGAVLVLKTMKVLDLLAMLKGMLGPYVNALFTLCGTVEELTRGWPTPGTSDYSDVGGWHHK